MTVSEFKMIVEPPYTLIPDMWLDDDDDAVIVRKPTYRSNDVAVIERLIVEHLNPFEEFIGWMGNQPIVIMLF